MSQNATEADMDGLQHDVEGIQDEDIADRLAVLEGQVDEATKAADRALDRVISLREEKRELEEQLDEASEERDELRNDIDQLRERTDLLETVRRAAASGVEERAAILIQTLYNEAYDRGERDTKDAATASMDYNKAKGALGGQPHREKIYRTFDRAEEIVGDPDLVEYIEETRSSPQNCRLVLDLEQGDLPERVAGHAIEHPEERE